MTKTETIELTYEEQLLLIAICHKPKRDDDTKACRVLVASGYADRIPGLEDGVTVLTATDSGRARREQLLLENGIIPKPPRDYLIWSNEHGAWWGPGERGYVREIARAGRYSKEGAEMICRRANHRPGLFNEIAFPGPTDEELSVFNAYGPGHVRDNLRGKTGQIIADDMAGSEGQ